MVCVYIVENDIIANDASYFSPLCSCSSEAETNLAFRVIVYKYTHARTQLRCAQTQANIGADNNSVSNIAKMEVPPPVRNVVCCEFIHPFSRFLDADAAISRRAWVKPERNCGNAYRFSNSHTHTVCRTCAVLYIIVVHCAVLLSR